LRSWLWLLNHFNLFNPFNHFNLCLDNEHHLPHPHFLPRVHPHIDHRPSYRARYVRGGFVGFDFDDGLIFFDLVTHFD
jgi:hypothetical protein